MIKVFVTGFNKPYAISGQLVSEDEQFLVLAENGVSKRIPQERIVYVEEFQTEIGPQRYIEEPEMPQQPAIPVPPQQQHMQFVPAKTSPEPKPQVPQPETNKFTEGLQKVLEKQRERRNQMAMVPPERASQIEPPEPTPDYDPNDKVIVEVNFSGTKKGQFDIPIPRGALGNKYTPALGREVFKHQEIKKVLMDGTAVLDGVPTVRGNKIFYNTKPAQASEKSAQEKIQMVGQMINAGSQLVGLQGALNTAGKTGSNSFSMNKSEFSMPASPFEAVPTLSVEESDPDAEG